MKKENEVEKREVTVSVGAIIQGLIAVGMIIYSLYVLITM